MNAFTSPCCSLLQLKITPPHHKTKRTEWKEASPLTYSIFNPPTLFSPSFIIYTHSDFLPLTSLLPIACAPASVETASSQCKLSSRPHPQDWNCPCFSTIKYNWRVLNMGPFLSLCVSKVYCERLCCPCKTTESYKEETGDMEGTQLFHVPTHETDRQVIYVYLDLCTVRSDSFLFLNQPLGFLGPLAIPTLEIWIINRYVYCFPTINVIWMKNTNGASWQGFCLEDK